MNIKDAVAQILKEAGEPLHVKEITERIIKEGLWTTNGKTPAASVGAQLYTEIKDNGDQSTFIQVAGGAFSLRDTQSATRYDAEESEAKNMNTDTNLEETYSFRNAAEKVLDQFGNRNAMHYRDITAKAIEQGWLSSSGKTPEATMNAQLVSELNQGKAGELGRFTRTSPGHYGLVKWVGTGLSHQISKHNKEVKKKLLAQLMDRTPAQFEELVGQLLAEMGFESIEVTKRGGDGGIDVRGTMLVNDVVRIKMAVQAKRWEKNIQSPIVQQVRGSLGVHEQGLIITTSNFSSGAIEEATQQDKTPVGLMNGEQLVTLLMEYNIGVRRISHDLFALDELPILKNGTSNNSDDQ